MARGWHLTSFDILLGFQALTEICGHTKVLVKLNGSHDRAKPHEYVKKICKERGLIGKRETGQSG